MPVIKTQNLVAKLAPGARVEVLCTDPGARSDIPAWCRINGHRILDIVEGDGELVLTLEVGEQEADEPTMNEMD